MKNNIKLNYVLLILVFIFTDNIFASNDKVGLNIHGGVIHDDNTTGVLDTVEESGAKWIRTTFHWRFLEPSKGEFQTLYQDQEIVNLKAHNLQVLAILGYCPYWASDAPDSETDPVKREHYKPKNYQDYVDFVTWAVNRYKPHGLLSQENGWTDDYGVRYWQIWNEENRGFWHGENPWEYIDLLRVAYNAIKAADPNAKVVFGGTAPVRGGFANPSSKEKILRRKNIKSFQNKAFLNCEHSCEFVGIVTIWMYYSHNMVTKTKADGILFQQTFPISFD